MKNFLRLLIIFTLSLALTGCKLSLVKLDIGDHTIGFTVGIDDKERSE